MTLFGEGGEGAGGAVDGAVADAEDGEHDDAVHDGGEARDARVGDGDDEGGGFGVRGAAAVQEARVGVGDEEADEGQGHDVEEGDAPEDLFDGGGEGFAWVFGFCGGEADQLGAGEGECCCDEGGAESFEAVVEL